jgi:predicted flavoprotein YhiN
MWSKDKIFKKLNDNKDKSKTKVLTDFIKLSKTSIALLKSLTKKSSFQSNELLSEVIVRLPIEIISTGTIEEAISTVGGVDLSAINTDLALNKLPNHYIIGEMLDYDAPTGGYLLQSCWSMAKWVCTRL